MSGFVLTSAAQADLQEIDDYLAARSMAAAEEVAGRLLRAMTRLGGSPAIGHLREDLADEPVRFWSVDSYLIVYRPQTRPIQVIRVLHGARDVRALLEPGAE